MIRADARAGLCDAHGEGYDSHSVRWGYRKELAAIQDPQRRQEEYDRLVAAAHAQGKAMVAATVFELDDVIDPADTRRWIQTCAASCGRRA